MSIRENFKRWQKYHQTVRELNALGNRELSDLGIGRSDIRTLARKHTHDV